MQIVRNGSSFWVIINKLKKKFNMSAVKIE